MRVGGSFYYDSPLNQHVGVTPNPTAMNGYVAEFNLQPMGLPGDAASPGLVLWPNPAHETVQVQLPVGSPTALTAELRDLTGRVVRTVPVGAGTTEVRLPLHGLASGIYALRCGAATHRLVVQ